MARCDTTIPAERENGNPLPVSELWGYIVLTTDPDGEQVAYGVEGGARTSYDLNDLAPGTWGFAVKALDTGGLVFGMANAPSQPISRCA